MTGVLIRGDLDRDATEGRPCEDTWRRCLLQLKRGCNRSFPHGLHKEPIHQYTDLRLLASRKVRKQVSVVYKYFNKHIKSHYPKSCILLSKLKCLETDEGFLSQKTAPMKVAPDKGKD